MLQLNINQKNKSLLMLSGIALLISISQTALANDDELAKKIQNPVADLISVPIKVDIDNGFRFQLTLLFPK